MKVGYRRFEQELYYSPLNSEITIPSDLPGGTFAGDVLLKASMSHVVTDESESNRTNSSLSCVRAKERCGALDLVV